jgi:hypothetical protein
MCMQKEAYDVLEGGAAQLLGQRRAARTRMCLLLFAECFGVLTQGFQVNCE